MKHKRRYTRSERLRAIRRIRIIRKPKFLIRLTIINNRIGKMFNRRTFLEPNSNWCDSPWRDPMKL